MGRLATPDQASGFLKYEEGDTMEVILRQAVDSLGHAGDLVKVSSGYARNFLLPRGMALPATDGNKKRISHS